ncbi:PREDICTED: neuropeptide S [Charadrius vociferus]|uniref:neuropeptide S n=1 Tax=Charadrius vociferus TaxID=50402 RepID=UPI0005212A16|nr:PREDICTED: neuropeptide S [Charadrius vociferus]
MANGLCKIGRWWSVVSSFIELALLLGAARAVKRWSLLAADGHERGGKETAFEGARDKTAVFHGTGVELLVPARRSGCTHGLQPWRQPRTGAALPGGWVVMVDIFMPAHNRVARGRAGAACIPLHKLDDEYPDEHLASSVFLTDLAVITGPQARYGIRQNRKSIYKSEIFSVAFKYVFAKSIILVISHRPQQDCGSISRFFLAEGLQGAMRRGLWEMMMTFGVTGSGFTSPPNLMRSAALPRAGGEVGPADPGKETHAVSAHVVSALCRLNFVFILWISTTFVCSGYPVVPSMSSNPFYLNCQLYGKSDYCLVLLNNCLAKVGRNEELAFLKPYLEMPLNKRSFRNGVGSGIKKTSFRRAKS